MSDVVVYDRQVVPDTAPVPYVEQQRSVAVRQAQEEARANPTLATQREHAHWVGKYTDELGFVDTKLFSHNLVLTSGYTLPAGKIHAGEAFQLLEGARLAKLTQDQVNIILQHVAKYA